MLYNDRYCRPPPERAIPDGEREARYFFLIFILFYLFILKQLNKWKDGGGEGDRYYYLPCLKHQFLMWLCFGLLGWHPRKMKANICERETKAASLVAFEWKPL